MRPLHTTHIDNLHIVPIRQHYAKSGEGSSFVHFTKSPTEIAGSVMVRCADICYTAKLKSSCYIYPGKPGNLWFPQACLDLISSSCRSNLSTGTKRLEPKCIQVRQTIVWTKCPYIFIYMHVSIQSHVGPTVCMCVCTHVLCMYDVCLSVCLFVCMSVCLSVCMSV